MTIKQAIIWLKIYESIKKYNPQNIDIILDEYLKFHKACGISDQFIEKEDK